ncbi:hypothetical protein G6F16_003396 [Rhizopus arrhizus]|nr:hypothetical protein G6F23_001874 [Rhizopus arrhizus]KAG0768560.1 hypothetical protein G6F24_001834 [Rhizopus arrhizus]KAG0793717.1 hypothetical protein G6F21_003410 [Rhizopus arrhizus]KAG0798034.1 hypothetical protein G6F22_004575 [Rhizopus arrhizus]KAG0819930.1 hypothetical protein G6F20_000366 [Rhizopus arrhizus]
MGQQTSKAHSELAFGYINQELNEQKGNKENEEEQEDFVLANPHLYQLQTICKQCNSKQGKTMIVSYIGERCSTCQGQKRLSLVRKDLAEDLEYIDQTYYPDLVHYNSAERDPMETELLELVEEEQEDVGGWSTLTLNQVTPTRRALLGPSMSVDLSNKCLIKLSATIGYLDNLNKLILSNNQMTELPKEVGYLKNLTVLNVSNNKINELPDTIAFLSKLKALNISENKLKTLPSSIGQLQKLVIIVANNNQITSLPTELSQLSNLVSLNVSFNPLRTLPAEVAKLPTLRKLLTEGCEFQEEYTYNLYHDPPSLLETCARIAVRHELEIPNYLTTHIKDYLASAKKCSYCQGPYFDSCVTRVRYIERIARNTMALEYTLCSAHWTDDKDRLLAMFSEKPETAHSTTKQNYLIDTDGLNEDISISRFRTYSDSGSSLGYFTPPTVSTPKSEHSADYFSLPSSSTPISRLKSKPSLPALPTMQKDHQRPRASSSASVTKRISNFIRSNSNNSIKQRGRSQSGSCLQYSVANSNDRIASSLAALDNNVDLISFRRQTKMANTSVEQQGQQEKVTIRS